MLRWFILTFAVFSSVSGQQKNMFEFTLNENDLSKCIEDFLLNFTNDPYYHEEVDVIKVVSKFAAHKFSGKTKNKSSLFKDGYDLVTRLRSKLDLFRNGRFHEPLHSAIKDALIDCAESKPVLIFENEPRELAHILDQMSVSWTTPIHIMIRSRNGRLTLRRYAEDAQVALVSALDYLGRNRNRFRIIIREMWMRRAQVYLEGRLTPVPDLGYRYTTRGIRMHDDIFKFHLMQESKNSRNRDPPVSEAVVRAFLNVHVADCVPYVANDIFGEYMFTGMSSAQYYIETQIDQFYRILIFFMELKLHGISTKEDDVFDGPLPQHVMQEELQRVIFNNLVYSTYLLNLRRKCLPKNDGQEEDLVPLLSKVIKLKVIDYRYKNTTVNFTSTTTPSYDLRFEGDGLESDMNMPFCECFRTEGKEYQFLNSGKNYGYAVTISN